MHLDASVEEINAHMDASVQELTQHLDASVEELNSSLHDFHLYTDGSLNRINSSIDNINTSINQVISDFRAADASIFSNLTDYIDSEHDYIRNVVDVSVKLLESSLNMRINPSISAIETYLKKTDNFVNEGGLTITHHEELDPTGTVYDFLVNVDSDTVFIVEDVLKGGKYKIKKDLTIDEDDTNLDSQYFLTYYEPGEDGSTYRVIDSDPIKVPKTRTIKNAFMCKAEPADPDEYPGGYKITSKPTDETWDSDTNPVYFCIEWDLNPGNASTRYEKSDGVTFVKVDDVFKYNFDIINASVNLLESGLAATNLAFTSADTSIFSGLNTSLGNVRDAINSSLNWVKATYVDGSLNRINGSIGDINTEIAALKEVDASIFSGLSSSIDDVRSYVDTTVTNYKAADTSIYSGLKSYTDSSVSSLKTYVDGSIGTVNGKINTINGNISGIESDISDLDDTISDLSTNVNGTVLAQLNTVNARMNEISSNMANVNASISTLTDTVNTFTSRVNSLDASVLELFNHWYEFSNTQANAWVNLYAKNPSLVK